MQFQEGLGQMLRQTRGDFALRVMRVPLVADAPGVQAERQVGRQGAAAGAGVTGNDPAAAVGGVKPPVAEEPPAASAAGSAAR